MRPLIKLFNSKFLVLPVYRACRRWYVRRCLRQRTPADVFTEIYKNNAWGGQESVSGPGSDVLYTRTIVQELPQLFREYSLSSVLDIPCGDFHWMKTVDLATVEYCGADIVEDLVQENNKRYHGERVRFRQLNLISDSLPDVDLIFCRDCLVHLSFTDVFLALENICRGNSRFLLTTTFTDRRGNADIATGQWRTLNLQISPFNFPPPVTIVQEMRSEDGDPYADKALGLWRIADIRERMNKMHHRKA